eukprot:TRINITY_DN2671_c0_g1_i1.p1 TRINITY_DN2671_c0_g1~~TRINITY_DN2671_c0_g1_i1.p1  ORF type:complete len:243 (-),score=47.56 TRINITY_DN2671_c0_g1_i1:929-1606(-)
MSTEQSFAESLLNTIKTTQPLNEIFLEGTVDAPHKVLTNVSNPSVSAGKVRLFSGTKLHKLVYTTLSIPTVGLEAYTIHGINKEDSALPAFYCDIIKNPQGSVLTFSLIQTLDLSSNLAYTQEFFSPLTKTVESLRKAPGISPVHINPLHHSFLNPWTVAYKYEDDTGFVLLQMAVQDYLAHWLDALEKDASKFEEQVGRENISARNKVLLKTCFIFYHFTRYAD